MGTSFSLSPPAIADQSPARSERRTIWLSLAVLAGVGAILLAGVAFVCQLALLMSRRQQAEVIGPSIPAFALISVILGTLLAWQAATGLRQHPSRPLSLSPGGLSALIVVYLLAVVAGQTVLTWQLATELTLPLFHTLAQTLPPFLLLCGAITLIPSARLTWRQVWGGLGGGAFGAVPLAFLLEAVLLVLGVLVIVVVLAATPAGVDTLRRLTPPPDGRIDPALWEPLLRHPMIIVILLLGAGLAIPLIEEAVKSLLPAVAGTWQRSSVQGLFLWGVAGGAGFAMLEGVINGGLSLQAWGVAALLRVGSSAMHCLGAGLTGWGWGEVWSQGRWSRLILTYLLAVALHGVWNTTIISMALAPMVLEDKMLASLIELAAAGGLLLLTLGMIVSLLTLARKLATDS